MSEQAANLPPDWIAPTPQNLRKFLACYGIVHFNFVSAEGGAENQTFFSGVAEYLTHYLCERTLTQTELAVALQVMAVRNYVVGCFMTFFGEDAGHEGLRDGIVNEAEFLALSPNDFAL